MRQIFFQGLGKNAYS